MGQTTSLADKHVAVVGGGNTAMDACRTAVRLGAKSVTNIYRRTKNEMPAQAIEIQEAEEEGVIFKFLTNPIEIQAEGGHVSSIRLQKMELGEPDASGRRSPVPIPDAEEILKTDLVLLAIGQNVNPAGLGDIALTKWKTIIADESSFITNLPGVFAVGDATNNGASIAIEAIGEAQKAAVVIDNYMTTGKISPIEEPVIVVDNDITSESLMDVPKAKREAMPHVAPATRSKNFEPVNLGFSEEQAKAEAHRCLECGCADYFECKLINYANRYNVSLSYVGDKRSAPIDLSHKHIARNPEKCILCGLCVQACEQLADVGALGFDGRGFNTAVKPAFGLPLPETGCVGCGQCVSLCPTGALTERLPLVKYVPLAETLTDSVCTNCSNGCNLTYTSHGPMLLRALPREKGGKPSQLCKKGRFEQLDIQRNRIIAPLLRKNGKLDEVSLEEVLGFINQQVETFDKNEIAVAISGNITNEIIQLILPFARKALKADSIYGLMSNQCEQGKHDAAKLISGNSRGFENAGIYRGNNDLEAALSRGDIKALFVFGDESLAKWRGNVSFLVIAAAAYSSAVSSADAVLPFVAPFEISGSITDINGQLRQLKAAVPPINDEFYAYLKHLTFPV